MRKQTDEFVIQEAENGNYEAIYELARRNLHGYVNIETNKEKAYELYKKVADESDIIDGKYMYETASYDIDTPFFQNIINKNLTRAF